MQVQVRVSPVEGGGDTGEHPGLTGQSRGDYDAVGDEEGEQHLQQLSGQ